MDSISSVETKVSATLPTPAAAELQAFAAMGARTESAAVPQVRLLHVDAWRSQDSDGRCDRGTGFGYAGTSGFDAKQMNNSIEFQIRLGPPCSPPV